MNVYREFEEYVKDWPDGKSFSTMFFGQRDYFKTQLSTKEYKRYVRKAPAALVKLRGNRWSCLAGNYGIIGYAAWKNGQHKIFMNDGDDAYIVKCYDKQVDAFADFDKIIAMAPFHPEELFQMGFERE